MALVVFVRPDMGVFGLYVGLTASGYNLARIPPGDPFDPLKKAIKLAGWPVPALRYFAKASTRGRGVNPYWPRAAMLLEACFYMQPGGGFTNADELRLLRAIAAFPVSNDDKDAATVAWVRDFPAYFRMITQTDLFPTLWTSYLDGLQPWLRRFERAASMAIDSFTGMTGVSADALPDLAVVPNPLQAPELVDFVRREGVLHVILAEPAMSSMIHELLHDVFGPVLRVNKAEIVRHSHLLRPVLSPMKRMQYAWADDEESWFRVFEESIMRAAAIWIENERRSPEADRQALMQARQGFIYVPALLKCLREKWLGPEITSRFVSACMAACTRSIP